MLQILTVVTPVLGMGALGMMYCRLSKMQKDTDELKNFCTKNSFASNERIAELQQLVDFSVRVPIAEVEKEHERLMIHQTSLSLSPHVLKLHDDPVRAQLLNEMKLRKNVRDRFGDYLVDALRVGNGYARSRNLPEMSLFDAITYVQQYRGIFAPGMNSALNKYYGITDTDHYVRFQYGTTPESRATICESDIGIVTGENI